MVFAYSVYNPDKNKKNLDTTPSLSTETDKDLGELRSNVELIEELKILILGNTLS